MTREEKVDTLIAQDIMLIRDKIDNRDYEFIYSILKGDGWTQYDLLSDEQINDEFKDRFDEIIKCSGILALANRLNGNFINFIKM